MTQGRPLSKKAIACCGALFAAGSLATAAAPAAAARRPARPAIEIVSPARGAVHVSERAPMRVRLRVAAGVRDLKVVVSGRRERTVTKRFGRAAGGLRTATLRPARELGSGPGALRVSGRLGGRRVGATAHFFVADRRARLLRVSGLPRRAARGPLQVRLRTAARVDAVRVRVNGRAVADRFSSTSSGIWRGSLSPDEGLRFGRNRIVVTAFDRDGVFDRVTRVVTIRRGRPLVGAGKDRLTRVRTPVRLDGRTTLPDRARGMRLSWRIVARPKGSKARLRNPHAVRPRLRPDVPGKYRIRLTATSRRVRGTASAAAAAPTASASDVTTVGAQPATTPRGISVGTIGSEAEPGLRVGRAWYPIGAGAVQLLVLDGETLQVEQNTTFSGNDSGLTSLAAAVAGLDESKIVMLENPSSRPLSASSSTAKALGTMFADLGIAAGDRTTGTWSASGLPTGGWSVISSPRSSPGTGAALIGVQQSPDTIAGEMNGFLQSTDTGGQQEPGDTYIFTWPSTYNTFDTRSGGDDATFNEMTVAGTTYRSETIAAGASAFHLVWLDGGTLVQRGTATIAGDAGQQLAQTLSAIDALPSPSVVLLSTIGRPAVPRNPDGATNGWATVAAKINSFGGNQNAFLALDGSGNAQYSLVGTTGIGDEAPNAGLDVSRNLRTAVPAAQLVGVFDRRPAGAWSVSTGGSPSAQVDAATLQPEIKQVLAQPDQPFQRFTGAGESAGEARLADQLGLPDDAVYGIRVSYWDPGFTALEWTDYAGRVRSYLDDCGGGGCTPGYVSVARQLADEFDDVSTIRGYFGVDGTGTLDGALHDEFLTGTYRFDQVSLEIMHLYPPQLADARGTSPLDVLEGMLDAASELAPEGGEVLGLAGAAMELGSAFTGDGGGGSTYLGATVFEGKASQFASTLTQQFVASIDGVTRLANLLVSDAGRLRLAAAKVTSDWKLSRASFIGASLDRSIAAYMWASLLPTTFNAYQCVVPPIYYPPEGFRPAPWYESNMKSDRLPYTPFTTVTHHPNPQRWGPMDTDGSQIADGFVTIAHYFDGTHRYLDKGVASDLFAPISAEHPEQLGLLPHYLLAPRPTKNSPGFSLDQGSFDPNTDNGYVSYSCAGNHWQEDTNVRGQ